MTVRPKNQPGLPFLPALSSRWSELWLVLTADHSSLLGQLLPTEKPRVPGAARREHGSSGDPDVPPHICRLPHGAAGVLLAPEGETIGSRPPQPLGSPEALSLNFACHLESVIFKPPLTRLEGSVGASVVLSGRDSWLFHNVSVCGQ